MGGVILASTTRIIILIVVILLIIAALGLAVHTYNSSDIYPSEKIAAISAVCDGEDILFTYLREDILLKYHKSNVHLVNITIEIDGKERSPQLGGNAGILQVGSFARYPGPFNNKTRLMATAYFDDDVSQVILDINLQCGNSTAVINRTAPIQTIITSPSPTASR